MENRIPQNITVLCLWFQAMNGLNNRSRLADAELDDSELFNEGENFSIGYSTPSTSIYSCT